MKKIVVGFVISAVVSGSALALQQQGNSQPSERQQQQPQTTAGVTYEDIGKMDMEKDLGAGDYAKDLAQAREMDAQANLIENGAKFASTKYEMDFGPLVTKGDVKQDQTGLIEMSNMANNLLKNSN